MRAFTMYRESDESKVSGTGRILDGIIFHTGQVVICWRTDIEGSKHGHSSIEMFQSWASFKFIHVDSHPTNISKIEFFELPGS